MKLYVSGGMTGWPNNNEDAFDRAAMILRGLGHEVVTPAEMDRADGVSLEGDGFGASDEEYESFLSRDLDLLGNGIEGVVFIRGWRTSGGAGREGRKAIENGLDLFTLEFWGGMDNGAFNSVSMMGLAPGVFLEATKTSRLRPGEEAIA